MQRYAGDIFQKNTIMSLKSSNSFTVLSTNQVLIILVYDIKDGTRRKVQILAIKIIKRLENKIQYERKRKKETLVTGGKQKNFVIT